MLSSASIFNDENLAIHSIANLDLKLKSLFIDSAEVIKNLNWNENKDIMFNLDLESIQTLLE